MPNKTVVEEDQILIYRLVVCHLYRRCLCLCHHRRLFVVSIIFPIIKGKVMVVAEVVTKHIKAKKSISIPALLILKA